MSKITPTALNALASIRAFHREEDRLPTETELGKLIGTTRNGARDCIKELIDHKILEKRTSTEFKKTWFRFKR